MHLTQQSSMSSNSSLKDTLKKLLGRSQHNMSEEVLRQQQNLLQHNLLPHNLSQHNLLQVDLTKRFTSNTTSNLLAKATTLLPQRPMLSNMQFSMPNRNNDRLTISK